MNTNEAQCLCGLKREDFQTTINGKKTDLYILKNKYGNEVAITNYGGAIVAIMVPDKNGNYANVIQGHDNIQDVINSPEPYLSTLIGRYGNRICKGKFQLNGKEYQLAINNGPNSLHGGTKGFNAKVWDALRMNDETLILSYVSSYGEEGYTGEVKVTVAYTFNDDNELANLKQLCDEIFGANNFIDFFSWVKTETPANLSYKTKKSVEYIVCYQKSKNDIKFRGLEKESKSSNGLMNQTNAIKELIFPANIVDTGLKDGVYKAGPYGTDSYDIQLLEDVQVKNGIFITPVKLQGKFKWSQ